MSDLWHTLRTVNSHDLAETRLQFHYGIQPIAAINVALTPAVADGSSASLNLDRVDEHFVFMGAEIYSEQPFRTGFNPLEFSLLLVDPLLKPLVSFPLAGQTLTDAFTWIRTQAAARGANSDRISLLSYPDDFPQHPIDRGYPFTAPPESHRQELTTFFVNSNTLLQPITATVAGSSPVRIWPHHFDIATLITLSGAATNGETQTIGVGFSPGDQSYPEPYWYVTPWPYPDPSNLPPLPGHGFWHRQGWVGAILTGSRLESAETQEEQVKAFQDSAIQACRKVLST